MRGQYSHKNSTMLKNKFSRREATMNKLYYFKWFTKTYLGNNIVIYSVYKFELHVKKDLPVPAKTFAVVSKYFSKTANIIAAF